MSTRSKAPQGLSTESQAPESQAFPKAEHLTFRSQFLRVQSGGAKFHTRHFILMVLANNPADGDPPVARRIGITVTKRVSKRAVHRNRVKRLVREFYRKNRDQLPAGVDLVVVAKRGAPELTLEQVTHELSSAARAARRAETKDL